MIQDIAPHHFDNAYHSYAPREEDFAIYCQPHQVLLKRQEDRIIFPTFRDLKKRNDDILENATYLFQIDEFRFFLVKHVNPEPLSGFQMENTEIFRLAEPQYLAFAGITAYQLYLWYESRKFCGCCGSPLRHDEKERMMYCDHCHAMEFPEDFPGSHHRTDPQKPPSPVQIRRTDLQKVCASSRIYRNRRNGGRDRQPGGHGGGWSSCEKYPLLQKPAMAIQQHRIDGIFLRFRR